jgi:hypothetical protein
MAGISLGGQLFDNGTIGPLSVVVGFWRRSEFKAEGYAEVQRVSGLDLVFPVPRDYRNAFTGKELDYTPEEGLFLRSPSG